ncbi:MAG: flagellar protein FlaG [Desulfatirhabdiaceae bacterium]
METTSSLNVQWIYTGMNEPKFSGHSVQQKTTNSRSDRVETSDQTDEKSRNQTNQTQNLEKAMPDILKDLEQKIDQMQEIGLQFSQYKDSGKIIVRVVEKETNRVIREIPSEEFMDLVEKMDQMIGILFNKKV